MFQGRICIKVLQLGKCEEGGGADDIDTENRGEAVMINVERVLEGETIIQVAVHGACIFDHINIFRGPSCSQI